MCRALVLPDHVDGDLQPHLCGWIGFPKLSLLMENLVLH